VDRHILKEQRYPSPRETNPSVPEALSKAVMECVRYRPHERPAGMMDVIHFLETAKAEAA
jgi:hypothetical protein